MEFLGISSVAGVLVAIAACFLSVEKCFLLLVVTAPLTTVAVLNISDSSICIYHLVWLVLSVRMILLYAKKQVPITMIFGPFLLFCLASTFLAFFNGDVVVKGVDGGFASVQPSFQQYTQWGYLFIAVSTAWYAMYMTRLGLVSVKSFVIALNAGLVLVLLGALFQLLLPVDMVSELYRNHVHTMYTFNKSRISSTFLEPSMLSLYLVPMMGIHLFKLLSRPNWRSGILLLASLAVCLQNNSSSAFLGLGVLAAFFVSLCLFSPRSVKIPHMGLVVSTVVFVLLLVVGVSGMFDSSIATLLTKLNIGSSASSVSVSGMERSESMSLMAQVFAEHPLVGVGWGTARGYDLLTTWAAEIGLVGLLLFFVPLIGSIVGLLRSARKDDGGFFGGGSCDVAFVAYLICATAILLVSVPEPYYLSFWLVVGVSAGASSLGEDKR